MPWRTAATGAAAASHAASPRSLTQPPRRIFSITYSRQIGPWAAQDGREIVLVRSFFRLVVRDRFFGRLGLLLGSFLGAPWVVLVFFRHFNSSIQPINSSIHRFNPSTHQLINSSTHGPSALSYPARRTARCAIKSAATRRVGACLNSFRNHSNSFKRANQAPRIPQSPLHLVHLISLASQIRSKIDPKINQKNVEKNRRNK